MSRTSSKSLTVTDPNNVTLRKERARLVAELRLKGKPVKEIGELLNLNSKTIERDTKYAEEHGLIAVARQRIIDKLIPKAEGIYEQVLTAPAAELADKGVLKGHELKLKAARQVAEGTGLFRKASESSMVARETIDLQRWVALNAEPAPEAVDAEPVPIDDTQLNLFPPPDAETS